MKAGADWRAELRSWAIEAPARLSGMAIFVGLALRLHEGRDGTAFPSLSTLAAECRCNRDTVRRALRDLELAGLVELERPAGNVPAVYRIRLPADTPRADSPRAVSPRAVSHDSARGLTRPRSQKLSNNARPTVFDDASTVEHTENGAVTITSSSPIEPVAPPDVVSRSVTAARDALTEARRSSRSSS